MLGAAWATTVAYGTLTVAYLVISQRLWHVAFHWSRLGAGLALTVALTLGGGLMPELPLLEATAVKGAYCLLYLGGIVALGVVPRRDLSAVAHAIHRRVRA
jgi:O-antigen/teichoic acid export membrane protein